MANRESDAKKHIEKIAYVPYEIRDNRSHQVMRDCIRELGYEVIDMEVSIKEASEQKVDAVFYSWFESVEGKTPARALYHYFKKMHVIRKLHRDGCKIICIFHNKYPHGLTGYNKFLSMKFTKNLYRRASRIVVMTEDAKQYLEAYLTADEISEKSFLIPHVGYGQLYPTAKFHADPGQPSEFGTKAQSVSDTEAQSVSDTEESRESDEFKLLFFGLIKPYKGIEVILETAERCKDLPIRFTICGKSYDAAYVKKLGQQAAMLPNVEWNPVFIPDEEINRWIMSADAVMLPYDVGSSLNSGAIMHAFSMGRTVISPMISTLTDFDPKLFYGYSFTPERQFEDFHKKVLDAYGDFVTDREMFLKKGLILKEQVERERSVEMIKEKCKALLNELERL